MVRGIMIWYRTCEQGWICNHFVGSFAIKRFSQEKLALV